MPTKPKPQPFPLTLLVTRDNVGTEDEYLEVHKTNARIPDGTMVAEYGLIAVRKQKVTEELV